MNYVLFLIILGLCGGGYYEYTVLEQTSAADQQQLTDLGGKIDTLQSENKKLEDDKTRLTKSEADDQAEIADLTTQAQTVQSALADAKQKIEDLQAPKPNTPAAVTTVAPPPTNSLGTIVTLDGKTFQNCQLLKVEADGVVVNHSTGITKVPYGLLSPEMQKKFGYDPHQGVTLTEAQVQFQEEKRKTATQATAN